MSFVTLSDLNTGDTVLGADWQDLKNNFEYLKSPPLNFKEGNWSNVVSGASWQDIDDENLNFTLSTDGGPVLVSWGCYIQGLDSLGEISIRLVISGDVPAVYGRARVNPSTDYESMGYTVPWVLAAGDHLIRLQCYLYTGSVRVTYPILAAREF